MLLVMLHVATGANVYQGGFYRSSLHCQRQCFCAGHLSGCSQFVLLRSFGTNSCYGKQILIYRGLTRDSALSSVCWPSNPVAMRGVSILSLRASQHSRVKIFAADCDDFDRLLNVVYGLIFGARVNIRWWDAPCEYPCCSFWSSTVPSSA